MKFLGLILSLLLSFGIHLTANQPIPYSGKISIRGVNYDGDAQFTFSLQTKDGKTRWRNGNKKDDSIKVRVRNGFYNVLLGGQGMNTLPPQLFLDYDELYLKVRFDNGDGKGLRHLEPNQRITATPRALVAEVAKKVVNGAITREMLSSEVMAKLDENASVANGSITASKIANNTITKAQLNDQILKYLKPEITIQPQAQTVYPGGDVSFSVTAEGKYLTFQWKKDGVDLAGETNATLNITDANATLHDGNYSVVVSNDFGNEESEEVMLDVNTTLLIGLVGWWKFDEGSGTVAYDSSGNGNDGNLMNGPTWVTGKIGGALSFDGFDDYVQIPNMQSFFSNAASFTTWVKVTNFSIANNQGLAEFGSSSHNLHYKFHGDNKIYMNILRSSDRVSAISPITEISEWHLLSITSINGGDWVMYQNFSEAKRVLAQNLSLPSSQSFGRSRHLITSFRYLQGLLDDIRIYDRALSEVEVQALYNLGQ